VLLELGNAFSRLGSRHRYVELVRFLRSGRSDLVVPASHELFDQGLRLFADREDKEWSQTDCTSFVVMRGRGIVEALTTDHHFEQAGFRILLK
jgi:predicted nucleic acid-binding protein